MIRDTDAYRLRAEVDTIMSGRARFVVDKEVVVNLLDVARRKWKKSSHAVLRDFSKVKLLSNRIQLLFEIMSDLGDILEAMSDVGRKAAKTKKKQIVVEEAAQ